MPTHFHADIFEREGVPRERIAVVGEPVDTSFFHPVDVDVQRAFRRRYLGAEYDNKFLILFVGKWETRKGLKILLKAFYEEFILHTNTTINDAPDDKNNGNMKKDEDVILVVVTSAYHSSDDFTQKIDSFLQSEGILSPQQSVWDDNSLHRIKVLTGIPQVDMPALYSSMNIVAIPSAGEGWGRPHVEAMSCATPVIATNWSGPTEYMTTNNSLPLRVEKMVSAEGWHGHNWAQPSIQHLKELLRLAFTDSILMKDIGNAARNTMLQSYSFKKFGHVLAKELKRIHKKLTGLEVEAEDTREGDVVEIEKSSNSSDSNSDVNEEL